MSTTILEQTQKRILKLSDSNKKALAKTTEPIIKLKPFYDLIETSEKAKGDFVPYIKKMTFHDTVNSVVRTLREPIAEIQEKRGVSKNQQYTFIELMITLFQQSYNAVLAIFTMIFGMLPLMEGLLTLCRFVLDKILEINNTPGNGEKAFKFLIFIAELIFIFIVFMLILSIILLPVFQLVEYNAQKVWAVTHN